MSVLGASFVLSTALVRLLGVGGLAGWMDGWMDGQSDRWEKPLMSCLCTSYHMRHHVTATRRF